MDRIALELEILCLSILHFIEGLAGAPAGVLWDYERRINRLKRSR